MTDLPARPNPQSVEYAQDAITVVTAFVHDDWPTVRRWVATTVRGGPESTKSALAGMLSVAGALLVETARAEGITVEEVVQRIALKFAEMEPND